jgi:Cof subfamily protein (haloacid dehalogenase superfamily)
MSIKMIALDLDGTTLNSDGIMTEKTRETLNKADDNGIHVVVSTGRVYTALPEQIFSVKGIRYAITSNGAQISDLAEKKLIYSDYLAPEAVRRAVEITKKYGFLVECFTGNIAYADEAFYNNIKENGCEFRNKDYVLKTRKPAKDICKLMTEHETEIENINFFFESIDELEKYRPIIEAIPNAMITSSFPNNLEVGGPGTCKRKALEALTKRLGVDRSELMCCGDAPNDIEMIKFAGVGVAMGNAWGDTKKYADYVTLTNDEDGVAVAIEKFAFAEE